MSHSHDALYRAICAHPEEDTPRLAYADLLEEDGDACLPACAATARAAFIRGQVELARYDSYDPRLISIRHLRQDLITGWGMAHTLPKVPGGYGWQSFEFRRGFPWKVGVISLDAFVGNGSRVFEDAPIQALEVDDRTRPGLAALARWTHLNRIRRLEFSLARFGAEALNRLGHSPHATELTELAFEYDGLTADGLEALTRSPLFPQLTSLELRSNVIPPALLVDALAAARPGRLSRLSLSANRLDATSATHLFKLPAISGLDCLDLSDNPEVGRIGIHALAASGVLAGVRTLNLSHTRPGVAGIRELIESGSLAAIRGLDLSANLMGSTAAKLLAESGSLMALRILDLSSNPIQDAGALALAKSPAFADLLQLSLGDCELTDAGAMALADSPHLGSLLRLDLTCREAERPFSGKARRALVERFGRRVVC